MIVRTILNFILISFVSMSFTSLSYASNFPELIEGSVWQSIVITKMGDLSFPGISKKWQVERSVDGTLILKERTQLSLGSDASGKQIAVSLSIPIGQTFSCEQFTNMAFAISSQLRRLPKGRFGLTFDAGFKFEVILIPSKAKSENRTSPVDIGVIQAPSDQSFVGALPVNYSNGFLHHTNTKKVLIDPSVPPRLLLAVKNSLDKWNMALSHDVYINPKVVPINDEDCLSTQTLCITWQGSQDSMSWIGWGGVTALSYDPEDGELIGGIIKLQNLRGTKPLLETPKDILESYTSKRFSSQFFASLMLRKEEFKTYSHPFENKLFESLLIHELGHANGLKHDFSASLDADDIHFSSSVMDYLPFPISFLVDNLQSRDIARLTTIYKQTPYSNYDGCSDEMEKSGVEINCAKGDWGSPEIWYSEIVSQSPFGVFETVVEYMSGLPERKYISIFAKFFFGNLTTKVQQQKVQNFICEQGNRNVIVQKLRDTYSVSVICP